MFEELFEIHFYTRMGSRRSEFNYINYPRGLQYQPMPRRPPPKSARDRRKHREALLNKKLGDLEHKYFNLVWLARKPLDLWYHPQIGPKIKEVETESPKEAEILKRPGEGDWQHGFHSGMLACVRLLSPYTHSDKELRGRRENYYDDGGRRIPNLDQILANEIKWANDAFPMLDT